MSRIRLYSVLSLVLLLGSVGNAQTAKTSDKTGVDTKQAAEKLNKAVDDYKTSLQKVAENYDQNVKTATDKSAQMKELFDQGLVSLREFEQSQQAISDAKAKAADIHNQIASADTMKATATTSNVVMIPGQVTNTNWSTGNAAIDGYIRQYSGLYGVDPYLVFCLIHQESGFTSSATSYKGARGLMQLMPDTAARYGVTKPYDAEQNIKAGTHYLKDLLTMFNGNNRLALAGYNAGEGAVMKYGYTIPPYAETQNYVRNIIARYSAGLKQSAKVETEEAVDQDRK